MAHELPRFPGGGRYRRLKPCLIERFGEPVHKVTLRGGFGCPNRDGRVGEGGCVFCSDRALLPSAGPVFGPVDQQLEAGLTRVARRTGVKRVIAYFQDQTATDAPLDTLESLFSSAITHPAVVALAVGTRPDWIPEDVVSLLAGLSRHKPVIVELGLQTASDPLLARINRGHTVADFESAVSRCRRAGLEVVAHVILGLPGETGADRDATTDCLNRVGVEGVKIHNLHVLENTPLALDFQRGKFQLGSLLEYADMAAGFLERLSPGMVIHRLTGEGPVELMIAPEWGHEKNKILGAIEKALESRNGWQGRKYADDGKTTRTTR
jgi:uncharacterized protein